MEERQFSVISFESSEKPLLSPDSARAMDFANMRKQRLVLDWRVPALTGRIRRIHSKQGFSEVSVIRKNSRQQSALSNQLAIPYSTNQPINYLTRLCLSPVTHYASSLLDAGHWALDWLCLTHGPLQFSVCASCSTNSTNSLHPCISVVSVHPCLKGHVLQLNRRGFCTSLSIS